ncbi:hypothetical protein BC567DRAFT_222186 [Phyllosticta citribraziliensis]
MPRRGRTRDANTPGATLLNPVDSHKPRATTSQWRSVCMHCVSYHHCFDGKTGPGPMMQPSAFTSRPSPRPAPVPLVCDW